MDRKLIKSEAKAAMKVNTRWLMLFLVLLIFGAITGASSFVLGLIGLPLFLAVIRISYDVLQNKDVDFNKMFEPYKDLNKAINAALLQLIVSFIIAIGYALLVVPGIYLQARFGFAIYAMEKDPTLSITDAMKKSSTLMQGHKMEYFVFLLSFIGWFIVVGLTFGIASIYVLPYVQLSTANFYRHLTGEQNVVDVQ
jgi:uncharacterized membrane protein